MSERKIMDVRPRVRVALEFKGPGRTKQSMAEACDINRIMRRYLKSGQIDHLSRHGGQYGVASSQTFHESMNIIRKAEEMFMDLPSDVRKRFHHDPGEFLDFINAVDADGAPVNLEEMRKLGLAKPEPVPEPEPKPREVVIVEDRRPEERYDDDGVVSATRGPRPPAPSGKPFDRRR